MSIKGKEKYDGMMEQKFDSPASGEFIGLYVEIRCMRDKTHCIPLQVGCMRRLILEKINQRRILLISFYFWGILLMICKLRSIVTYEYMFN